MNRSEHNTGRNGLDLLIREKIARGYGRDGGFSLIFDSLELGKSYRVYRKKCSSHVQDDRGCEGCSISFFSSLFACVCYDYHDSKIEGYDAYPAMKKMAEILLRENAIAELERLYLTEKETIQNNINGIFSLLALQKNHAFHEESEIRFFCLNRGEKYSGDGGGFYNQSPYEISIENNAPRLKIKFLTPSLKKIIIGPQPSQDKAKILISHHLEANGYQNVEIIKSSIPFR